MTGRAGQEDFVFNSLRDGNADVITDFEVGHGRSERVNPCLSAQGTVSSDGANGYTLAWGRKQEKAMRKANLVALAAVVSGAVLSGQPAAAASLGRYEVTGVKGEDMLKMRAGPGTGYIVIVGLPNGTVLRVDSCTQTGGTRWCAVALDRAPGLKGYVSWAYLQKR